MTGKINNIQRFSLTDGDGIRTTVFFKGCNMKCKWCHNPETINGATELIYYRNKCIGCGKCFEVCPNKAHKIDNGVHIIDRNLCVNCGKCAEKCYAEALEMCGKDMTIDEIMKEIRQDIPYYNNSNGGVTLSGGEALCQRDFAIELCKACRKEGIKVAIETNLNADYKYAKELLQETDLIMCDLKIFDDKLHLENTGVSNKRICENIKKIDELGIPIIVRTPLVPGVTDYNRNITQIAEYIKPLKNLIRYELLNFNPLGEGKYKALGKENTFDKVRPLGKERLDELKDLVNNIGVRVKIV